MAPAAWIVTVLGLSTLVAAVPFPSSQAPVSPASSAAPVAAAPVVAGTPSAGPSTTISATTPESTDPATKGGDPPTDEPSDELYQQMNVT